MTTPIRPKPILKIDDLRVVASQHAIVRRLRETSKDDLFGEYVVALAEYLDWDHIKVLEKERIVGPLEEVTEQSYHPRNDDDLRKSVEHYRHWWRQKVEDGRGISVHRGRAQMVNLLFLAGVESWQALDQMDGGWYQEDAYNAVADLFGWPHVMGSRSNDPPRSS